MGSVCFFLKLLLAAPYETFERHPSLAVSWAPGSVTFLCLLLSTWYISVPEPCPSRPGQVGAPLDSHQQYGSFAQSSSSHRRATSDARPGRKPRHPKPNIFSALQDHTASSNHAEHQTWSADPKDLDPCVHGLWCWERTFAMGQGSSTSPRKDSAHERCRRPILASRDPGQQSKTGARQ